MNLTSFLWVVVFLASPQSSGTAVSDVHEEIVVTATRRPQELLDATALVTVIEKDRLSSSPAPVLDETLRQVPGFGLFRRSSSLVAHPTTQGVSLRGIGPSGTSRTLVLFDTIPLNDPFGGWIYWNRIPTLLLDRVEILRGAASQLYGSSALGGVVQLLSRPAGQSGGDFKFQAGTHPTLDLEVLIEQSSRDWALQFGGRLFDSEGYFLLDAGDRGPVDVPAGLDFRNFFGRFSASQFHLSFNLYDENRNNGTRLQTNDSTLWLLEGGMSGENWSWSAFGQQGHLASRFSRVLPERSEEVLTASQRFDWAGAGGAATWWPLPRLLIGSDWRIAEWDGNTQNLAGGYLQWLQPVGTRLALQSGARFDVWENENAESTISPRLGLLFRANDQWTIRGSAYRGFRAPTLNELFRPFRVGNVVTQANPNLGDETVWGGEVGADFHPTEEMVVRLNAYWNLLEDPVGNVTLGIEDGLIQRRRENLGTVRIGGLEGSFRWRVSRSFLITGAYLLSDTQVRATGLDLPQVPLHQGVASVVLDKQVKLQVTGRYVSRQYDDDLNQLPLGDFFVMDVSLRRPMGDALEIFLSAENLLDRRIVVGRTPEERLGQPLSLYGGLRLRLY